MQIDKCTFFSFRNGASPASASINALGRTSEMLDIKSNEHVDLGMDALQIKGNFQHSDLITFLIPSHGENSSADNKHDA